jgi:SHS2 domain-containing protein
MYETFDHTADVGLRVRAAEINDLFSEAARAMFSVMADLDEVRAGEQVDYALEDSEIDELLRKWLAELLYTFHVRHLLLSRFDVAVDKLGDPKADGVYSLAATAWGEPIDPNRHKLDVEIKAVTWHGLRAVQTPDGWLAEVIVDL